MIGQVEEKLNHANFFVEGLGLWVEEVEAMLLERFKSWTWINIELTNFLYVLSNSFKILASVGSDCSSLEILLTTGFNRLIRNCFVVKLSQSSLTLMKPSISEGVSMSGSLYISRHFQKPPSCDWTPRQTLSIEYQFVSQRFWRPCWTLFAFCHKDRCSFQNMVVIKYFRSVFVSLYSGFHHWMAENSFCKQVENMQATVDFLNVLEFLIHYSLDGE